MQPPTEQSEISGITSRSDIQPVQVSYDSDPELKGLIETRDAALFEGLFDQDDDVTKVSRCASRSLSISVIMKYNSLIQPLSTLMSTLINSNAD